MTDCHSLTCWRKQETVTSCAASPRVGSNAPNAADADGGRRGGPDRRRAARAQRRAAELPDRLPRPYAGYAAGRPAVADPEAAAGQLLPTLPGAQEDLREGARGGDPGSLDRRRLDAAGG